MTRYEFMVIPITPGYTTHLDEYGNTGWHIAAMGNSSIIMEREVPDVDTNTVHDDTNTGYRYFIATAELRDKIREWEGYISRYDQTPFNAGQRDIIRALKRFISDIDGIDNGLT